MIWPQSRFEPLVTISPFSMESLGPYLAAGQTGANVNGTTSQVWPSANLALFIPFYVSRRTTITQIFCLNGATVAGNLDVGIYTQDGTRIVSSGSTAQAGANAIQALSITATQLSAGVYYMAMSMSSATATIFRTTLFNNTATRSIGVAQMASALPLPATATFASATFGTIPLFALTTRTVI